MSLRDLQTAALQLSFAERSELAKALLLSLEQPTATELEAMWESEINQRIEATERGELKLISSHEAFARARDELNLERGNLTDPRAITRIAPTD